MAALSSTEAACTGYKIPLFSCPYPVLHIYLMSCVNIRPAWFSNSLMPLRTSAGQLSVVRINEPADDETRPAESRHRGGSECKLLPMRHTWHRAQEAGECTDRFCHTWLSPICCVYHKAACRSAATVYTVHIPVKHMLHTRSCLEIS